MKKNIDNYNYNYADNDEKLSSSKFTLLMAIIGLVLLMGLEVSMEQSRQFVQQPGSEIILSGQQHN